MVISTGMTNVVAPRGRSWKRWVVVGVVAAAVIGLGVVVAVIIPRLLNPAAENASQAFNIYANYLLFGEKSREDLGGEYVRTTVYRAEAVLEESDEAKREFYAEADELLGAAIDKYAEEGGSDEMGEQLENQRELLEFARVYAETTELTDELVLNAYLDGGEDAAKQYVVNNYAGLSGSGNALVAEYWEVKERQFAELMNAFNVYRDMGCIKGSVADEACASNLARDNGAIQGYYGAFYEDKYTAEQMVLANRDDLLGGCWTIGARLAEMREAT